MLTRLKAIRVRCLASVGYEKKAVRECDLTGCSLHDLRMGRGSRPYRRQARNWKGDKDAAGTHPKWLVRNQGTFPARAG